MQASRRDQVFLGEVRVIHFTPLSKLPLGPVDAIGILQANPLQPHTHQMQGRLDHHVRIAVNVHKLGLWKRVQQQFDAAGVRRRLQDERLAVFQREFAQEAQQPFAPARNLLNGCVSKRQKSIVMRLASREGERHVICAARLKSSQRRAVLWLVTQRRVLHGSRRVA